MTVETLDRNSLDLGLELKVIRHQHTISGVCEPSDTNIFHFKTFVKVALDHVY